METNLAKILWKKEVKHWKRIVILFKRIKNWFIKLTFGILFALLLILIHYGFALMSTLWESFLWVVARKQFKANIQKMALTVQL